MIERLNPRDGDEAEVALCIAAVACITAYVTSLPCTCKTLQCKKQVDSAREITGPHPSAQQRGGDDSGA